MPLANKNPATRNRRNELILRPVHPNAGIESAYRKRLLALIDEMNRSFAYWIKAAWRSNEPVLAGDETPAITLRDALRDLSQRWRKRFDTASKELADYFARASTERSDAALRAILKKGGFSVEFKLTPAARDILQATIAENVALIKSIPEQYLTNVEGLVMRSVQAGRDLEQLTKDLQEQFGVTKRRAVVIARTQNNLATSAMTRARQEELGITTAKWQHSGGGRHPRKSHLEMSGKDYDVRKGMWDPEVKQFIWPGQLINCRCVSKPLIRGFS